MFGTIFIAIIWNKAWGTKLLFLNASNKSLKRIGISIVLWIYNLKNLNLTSENNVWLTSID